MRIKMSALSVPTAIVCVAGLLTGCATLNGNVPFRYTPSLSQGEPIDLNVGVKKFVDNRTAEEKKSTKSISDIDDKVTAKVIEDLRASQLFMKVSFPSRPDSDDIVLSGEIKKFDWKMVTSPLNYIPFLNLILFFGLPAGDLIGDAHIVVTAADRTGRKLGVYDKSESRKSTFNIYQGKTGEMGAELGDAFREVIKAMKDDIYRDAQAGKFNQK